MFYSHFSVSDMREFLRYINYPPNGAGGCYCRPSQKKRRKLRRRMGKGRR